MSRFLPYRTPLLCAQWSWHWPIDHGTPPPTGMPIRTDVPCNIRMPRPSEAVSMGTTGAFSVDLIIGFAPRPAGSATRYYSTFDAVSTLGTGQVQSTLFELPPGSGQFWICLRSVIVARSFVNEHKNCLCSKGWANQSVEKV